LKKPPLSEAVSRQIKNLAFGLFGAAFMNIIAILYLWRNHADAVLMATLEIAVASLWCVGAAVGLLRLLKKIAPTN
jgi:hypothetical protein